MDGLCCIRLNNKTIPIDDNSKRSKKQANDQKKKKALASDEKKKLRKMKLKSCWKKKGHKAQKRGISSLASLVNTMSFKSGPAAFIINIIYIDLSEKNHFIEQLCLADR